MMNATLEADDGAKDTGRAEAKKDVHRFELHFLHLHSPV